MTFFHTFGELTAEEQLSLLARLDSISLEVSADQAGLKTLLSRGFEMGELISDLKAEAA